MEKQFFCHRQSDLENKWSGFCCSLGWEKMNKTDFFFQDPTKPDFSRLNLTLTSFATDSDLWRHLLRFFLYQLCVHDDMSFRVYSVCVFRQRTCVQTGVFFFKKIKITIECSLKCWMNVLQFPFPNCLLLLCFRNVFSDLWSSIRLRSLTERSG